MLRWWPLPRAPSTSPSPGCVLFTLQEVLPGSLLPSSRLAEPPTCTQRSLFTACLLSAAPCRSAKTICGLDPASFSSLGLSSEWGPQSVWRTMDAHHPLLTPKPQTCSDVGATASLSCSNLDPVLRTPFSQGQIQETPYVAPWISLILSSPCLYVNLFGCAGSWLQRAGSSNFVAARGILVVACKLLVAACGI